MGVGGCGTAGRGLAGARGQREGRNYSGPFSPPAWLHPEAQTANDHPVCQAKMFPVQASARLNPPGAHRKPFPEASAPQPPWDRAPRAPQPAPPTAFNCPIPPASGPMARTRVKTPDPTSLRCQWIRSTLGGLARGRLMIQMRGLAIKILLTVAGTQKGAREQG